MITIYHLDTSRSERIVWLMEELGLDYAIEAFDRRPDILAPDDLKRIHPLGRAPIIKDGDVVLAESGAIVEYIVARYGPALAPPPADPAYPQYLYWLHYAESSLMLQLLREWSLDRMLPNPDTTPAMAKVRANTRQHLDFVNQSLTTGPYIAGPFTAADIMMAFPFTTLRHFRDLDLTPHPNIQAWLSRIKARPAYHRAMQKAGPGIKGSRPPAPQNP